MRTPTLHALARQALLLVAMVFGGSAALADVYMWKDPATGKTRMTNIAPPWLREPKPGVRIPKVEVIRDGKVLDPATAFATPEPPPLPTRRRLEEANAPANAGIAGAAGVTKAADASARGAPQPDPDAPSPLVGLPPGVQLPAGMMLVPIPSTQDLPAPVTR